MLGAPSYYPFLLPLAPFDQGQFQFLNLVKQPSNSTNERQDEEERRCPLCPEDKVRICKKWYPHPDYDSIKICTACYQRIMNHKKAEEMVAKGVTCSECPPGQVHKITTWRLHPNNKTNRICNSCYFRIIKGRKVEEMDAKGIKCPQCPAGKVRKVKKWRIDPNDKTKQICESCYRRILKDRRTSGNKKKEDSDDRPQVPLKPFPFCQRISSPPCIFNPFDMEPQANTEPQDPVLSDLEDLDFDL